MDNLFCDSFYDLLHGFDSIKSFVNNIRAPFSFCGEISVVTPCVVYLVVQLCSVRALENQVSSNYISTG